MQAAALGLLLLSASLCAAAAAPAGERGTIPVAFEGSALLITYYAGVAEALLERGVVVPGKTMTAGLSGGAFTGAFLHLGECRRLQWEAKRQWGGGPQHCHMYLDRHTPPALLPHPAAW